MAKLSFRLSLIASLVPYGARVCDIGTDHGYLAIELVKNGTAQKVIASDIAEKPLNNARKNIESANISNIELRLGSGLSCIKKDEVDTVIIAGMGGEVIASILKDGKKIAENGEITILLQPTTSPEALRAFLYSNGYTILKEIPIYENSKLYSVMVVKFTDSIKEYSGFNAFIGMVSPETNEGVLYIKKQQKRCYECMIALENVPAKQSEFLFYKQLYSDIEQYLNKFGEN